MHRKFSKVFFTLILGLSFASAALALDDPMNATRDLNRPRGPQRAIPRQMNRVHDAGKVWMNITNYGYFGNEGPGQSGTLSNPCPPERWAPQCEFPGGSNQQYLYRASLWVGALIDDEGTQIPRVSVGFDGWFDVKEMFPGEGDINGIKERSIRPGYSNCLGELVTSPDAVSDQDFIAVWSDTLKDEFYVARDNDGSLHVPLGIKMTQTSYSFSQAFAEDFILIDYEFENIASNYLKNVYVGLYVDSDVGPGNQNNHHTDDICGFRKELTEVVGDDTFRVPIDIAYIADNDGRPPSSSGGAFDCPNVSGTRVIRAPNPRLATSFNWYTPNATQNLDYGPSWFSHANSDSEGMDWMCLYGTPTNDRQKYQLLKNREFDFDQVYVDNTPSTLPPQIIDGGSQTWSDCDLTTTAQDIANGYDTRYVLSWGPLGVFDYIDGSGNRIYRLNPGEKFSMTIAYVCGENFHDINNPQQNNQTIDPTKFNFADLDLNAKWAKDVYDNRMLDTRIYDWGEDHDPNTVDGDGSQDDGIYDSGDGWFGEDVGADGLYADLPPGVDSVEVVYFRGTEYEIRPGWYKGPDEGERNGLIDAITNPAFRTLPWGDAVTEDNIIPPAMFYHNLPRVRDWDVGWMSGNGYVDFGDGIPDFTGPPPPPIPALLHKVPNTTNAAANFGGIVRTDREYIGALGYELRDDEIILRWSKSSSESPAYSDPFSRKQDFEGYRIHSADINQDGAYSLEAEFDIVNFAYYSDNDSLMTYPYTDITGLPQDSTFFGVVGHLRPVGLNIGFNGTKPGSQNIVMNDSTYEFRIKAHKLAPRYYSVTAYDYGDPRSGLAPQSTRPTANAVLLAPAGNEKKPVTVVPNPYRAYQDYTQARIGISWENQNDGTAEFYPQQDRRIEFMNLPERCLIRIFTVAGDLVQIIPHNEPGDVSSWASLNSEAWNLNSRNNQQAVSGIYLFSVENKSEGHGGEIETGKFVIIR